MLVYVVETVGNNTNRAVQIIIYVILLFTHDSARFVSNVFRLCLTRPIFDLIKNIFILHDVMKCGRSSHVERPFVIFDRMA